MHKLTTQDGITFVTLENGKCYKLAGLEARRRQYVKRDDWRDDQTRKRRWYRSHVVSRDMPNSKASRADYGDGGKFERLLVAWLDNALVKRKAVLPCLVAKRNCQRIARRLMLISWLRVGHFVAAVWENGNAGRDRTISELGISQATYYWRLAKYAEILGYTRGVDMC